MADNTRGGSQDAGDPLIATDEVTYSGDTADVQLVRMVGVTGSEGSKTVVEPPNLLTEVTGTGAALNATPITSTDCTATPFVAVQLTGTWSATASFEVSNDNSTWVTTYLSRVSTGPLTSVAIGTAMNDIYAGPVHGKYFRVRLSAYTSGTVNARAEFFSRPVQYTDTDVRVVLSQSYPGSYNAGGDARPDNYISTYNDTGTSDGPLGVMPFVFSGASWERLRGDTLGLHVSRQATAATATLSNVAGSASSVTLLALNTARKGASIHNDSSAILYVKFGTTASTTSFTVKMVADAHYEVPFGYTGRIDGIWASATGNARVTEMT